MGIFGRGSGGGLMNVIRCDEQDYLVWKWRPQGQEANSTSRENSIRWGSSLRVKEGEVAVFVYPQKDGTMQDFIVGPFDQTIKTSNFPVLTNIIGLAYGGDSPFQAEVYFINLQQNNQVRFAVPYFDAFDPRLPDHGIPVAVRGTMTFNITDYQNFIKLNRLVNFDKEQFVHQIQDAVRRNVKSVVMNLPQEMGIPLVQIERQIMEVNDRVTANVKPRIEGDFGVNLKALDIAAIEVNKESPYYEELRQLTAGITARTMQAQADVNIKNLQDTQELNRQNMEETMRIQREEAQRAQRLQTETQFIGAHALDQQTTVLKAGAESLGQAGSMGGGEGGGGMNAAGLMTGMMMGGAMGQQMAGMMGNMGQYWQQAQQGQVPTPPTGGAPTPPPMPGATPPPMPTAQFHVAIGGSQAGPFTIPQMQQLVANGQLKPDTLVWKPGMAGWTQAQTVPELTALFAPAAGAVPPPLP
ncbi:MAG: SPFH domain-containing protein [Bacteroidaceae bacterium]|nr:SPFH domain-containing protein [Bacteroidaceae bacterium]